MSSRRDRTRAVAAWFALSALLAGCKDDASPAHAGARAAAPPAAGSAAPALPSAPLPSPLAPRPAPAPAPTRVITLDEPRLELPRRESLQLLDPGRGARSTLRYALAAGTMSVLVETRLSSRHLERDAFTRPTALPAIRDGFAITVAAGDSHQLSLRGLPGEAAETPETRAYLAAWRALLQDRSITVAIDERGAFSAITFTDDPRGARSDKARDELVQRLLALIVPLPDEPVGVGASWRAVTILRQGPAYAKQTATYTLRARSARRWKLHAKLQRVGEEQRITDPSLPAGTTADLVALFRALEGDVDVDPARALIVGGSLTIESRLHVRLQPPGRAATEQIFEDTGTAVISHQP